MVSHFKCDQNSTRRVEMEIGQLLELALRYAVAPLLAVVWYMFKKQDNRIENLEKRTTDVEKTLIEIRTDFRYITKDISEIKDILKKMQTK